MIEGVKIKKLSVHKDDRGLLMEFLRNDDKEYKKFGQVYLTLVKKNVVKGWHYHKIQTDHFICVEGQALVALFDMRENSPSYKQSQDFILSAPDVEGEQLLLVIPNGVVHGFTAHSCNQAKIINIPTEIYNYDDPDEHRFPWNSSEIDYKWPENITSGG